MNDSLAELKVDEIQAGFCEVISWSEADGPTGRCQVLRPKMLSTSGMNFEERGLDVLCNILWIGYPLDVYVSREDR